MDHQNRLIDPFDYGDHKFVVKDEASGEMIFSHHYCTLFREWQTTEESQSVRRAFPHVLRFPWPLANVVVEIHDRNSKGVFNMSWSASFDPASIYLIRGIPIEFESVDLEIQWHNGGEGGYTFPCRGIYRGGDG